ncbi:PaaI family thioesterase [Limnohabitans sp.]|uniref:PaaI family thioesterase n=1 Tax=Limnohabitans sp. TaxID=1907725 RepID=UPI0025C3E287|nr:PaaI family thioesterase [Limnohabitans sp.]
MSLNYNTADTQSYFSRMLNGEVARPPVLTLLGSRIDAVDAEAGMLSATYEASPDFRNPAGTVQGGMLSAMLDDLTASLVDATLAAGQGVATLNLNVSFLRVAEVGTLQGEARLLRRGRDVCHVMGTLRQDGKEVATAVAVCKVVPVT